MTERRIGGRSDVGSQQVTGHVTGPPESAAASITGPPASTAPSVTGPLESAAASVTEPPESTVPSVTGPPESAAPSSSSCDEHADSSKTADRRIMAGQSHERVGLGRLRGRPFDPLRRLITGAARSELQASTGIAEGECKSNAAGSIRSLFAAIVRV